jgi:hypothetical protein
VVPQRVNRLRLHLEPRVARFQVAQ